MNKYTLIMLTCCLIPVAALMAVIVFDVTTNSALFYALVLLCPLSHVLMMKSDDAHRHSGEISADQVHSERD